MKKEPHENLNENKIKHAQDLSVYTRGRGKLFCWHEWIDFCIGYLSFERICMKCGKIKKREYYNIK
jgi:hypothetical protein